MALLGVRDVIQNGWNGSDRQIFLKEPPKGTRNPFSRNEAPRSSSFYLHAS